MCKRMRTRKPEGEQKTGVENKDITRQRETKPEAARDTEMNC